MVHLTVRGVTVPLPEGAPVVLVLETDPRGSTLGPVLVEVRGGTLRVDGGAGPALTVTGEATPFLVLDSDPAYPAEPPTLPPGKTPRPAAPGAGG